MADVFWLTGEEILAACKYALRDASDHFVGDVIDHADVNATFRKWPAV